MALFEWKDSYNIGVDEIDRQHRTLMDLINRLDEMNYAEAPRQELASVFAELSAYICTHFRTEEQLMTRLEYPEQVFKAHVKLHRQFEDEIDRLEQDTRELSGGDYKVVLSYLTHWFIRHICKVDQKLGNYVVSRRLQAKKAEAGRDDIPEIDDRVRHGIQVVAAKIIGHTDRAEQHLQLLAKEQRALMANLLKSGLDQSTRQELELLLEETRRDLSSIREELDSLSLLDRDRKGEG